MEIQFILVEPAVPENVGAAARAIKTMGFGRLALVNTDAHQQKAARILAHGARDILEQAETFGSLEAAVHTCDLVIGTTAKKRHHRDRYLPADALSAHLSALTPAIQRAGIVFGREESGLTADEIQRCDLLSHIPLAQPYPSLNLGQAVMLYAWELSHLRGTTGAESAVTELAQDQQWQTLKGRVGTLLDRLGFPKEDKLSKWANESLGMLDARDVRLLHALLARIEDTLP